MQTDWYDTNKLGTYLVLPTGVRLSNARLTEEARNLMEGASAEPFLVDVDSRTVAQSFNFLGVDDCLKESGFSLIRS